MASILNKNFIYCFNIILNSGKKLYLTTQNQITKLKISQDKVIYYHPYYSLSLLSVDFNDSAFDNAVIQGLYEKSHKNEPENQNLLIESNLMGACIEILIIKCEVIEYRIKMYCYEFHNSHMKFIIKLRSSSYLLNQNLLEVYSKTCRAKLGDEKCGFVLKSEESIVESYCGNILVISSNKPDGYFTQGRVEYLNVSIKILKHVGGKLFLENNIKDSLSCNINYNSSDIKLELFNVFPCCDKLLKTCYNKFNNIKNFRGEPFIVS